MPRLGVGDGDIVELLSVEVPHRVLSHQPCQSAAIDTERRDVACDESLACGIEPIGLSKCAWCEQKKGE